MKSSKLFKKVKHLNFGEIHEKKLKVLRKVAYPLIVNDLQISLHSFSPEFTDPQITLSNENKIIQNNKDQIWSHSLTDQLIPMEETSFKVKLVKYATEYEKGNLFVGVCSEEEYKEGNLY